MSANSITVLVNKNRSSSAENSDYNVDDENDEPVFAKASIQFNQPINQKKAGVFNSINFQDNKDYTPDRTGHKDDYRPSDLVQFQTPGGGVLSPIAYSSIDGKMRGRNDYPLDEPYSGSEISDDYKYLGTRLNARDSRPKDVSPHNRNARPRSS